MQPAENTSASWILLMTTDEFGDLIPSRKSVKSPGAIQIGFPFTSVSVHPPSWSRDLKRSKPVHLTTAGKPFCREKMWTFPGLRSPIRKWAVHIGSYWSDFSNYCTIFPGFLWFNAIFLLDDVIRCFNQSICHPIGTIIGN